MTNLRKMWNDACLSAGIPSISVDTAARIMAVVYVHGNNEQLVYNNNFLSDIEYIQNRFNVIGSEIPDAEFIALVKKYSCDLEEYYQRHKDEHDETAIFKSHIPEWANILFKERYNIKLIN